MKPIVVIFLLGIIGCAFAGSTTSPNALKEPAAAVQTAAQPVPDQQGNTELHHAASQNDGSYIEKLARSSFNPDPINNNGETPLMIAAERGYAQIAKLLVEAGASLTATSNKNNWTPLHHAAKGGNTEIITVLITKGAQLNAKGKDLETPLYCAVRANRVDAVRLLVKNGADFTAALSSGWTLVHEAAFQGHTDSLVALIELGADVNTQLPHPRGDTPLMSSAFIGNAKAVNVLIQKGAEIDRQNVTGATALHFATYLSTLESSDQTKKKAHEEVVQLLIENGATIDLQDNEGFTPLHKAVTLENWDIVRLLLLYGANLNTRNARGDTPLHDAAILRKMVKVGNNWVDKGVSKTYMQLLVDHGAEINPQNNYGRTPLHDAVIAGHEDCVTVLLDNHADPQIKDNEGLRSLDLPTSPVIKALLENSATP